MAQAKDLNGSYVGIRSSWYDGSTVIISTPHDDIILSRNEWDSLIEQFNQEEVI